MTPTEQIGQMMADFGVENVRKVASAPYDQRDRRAAVTVGFCHALADRGLTIQDFNHRMSQKQGVLKEITDIGVYGTLGLILMATLGGNATGKFQHSVEQRLNKSGDNENVAMREKLKRLASQRDNLTEDIRARTPVSAPPSDAPSKEILNLLD